MFFWFVSLENSPDKRKLWKGSPGWDVPNGNSFTIQKFLEFRTSFMLKLGRRDNPEILGKWLTTRTVLTERKFSTKISGIFLWMVKNRSLRWPKLILYLQSRQVKCTPQDSVNELNIWKKNESVSYSRNVVSNSIRHSACVMNSEYVTRTSLYLDKLKIFEWMKFLRRHLHQIQGNWAGRKVLTASRVNSRLIMHARMQKWIWNLQVPTDSTFE